MRLLQCVVNGSQPKGQALYAYCPGFADSSIFIHKLLQLRASGIADHRKAAHCALDETALRSLGQSALLTLQSE